MKLNRQKCSNNRNRQGPSGSEAKFQFKQLLFRDMGTFFILRLKNAKGRELSDNRTNSIEKRRSLFKRPRTIKYLLYIIVTKIKVYAKVLKL